MRTSRLDPDAQDTHSRCRRTDYDPARFPDPSRYDPARWYGASERDALAFGLGARVCIGRRFALTQATCLLAMLLREWRVVPCLRGTESVEQWRERALQGSLVGISFGVSGVALKLVRRQPL